MFYRLCCKEIAWVCENEAAALTFKSPIKDKLGSVEPRFDHR